MKIDWKTGNKKLGEIEGVAIIGEGTRDSFQARFFEAVRGKYMAQFFEALSDKKNEIVIATMGVYLCGCGSDSAFTQSMNAIRDSNAKIIVASSCVGDSYDPLPGNSLRKMGKYFCDPAAAVDGIPDFVIRWNAERREGEIVPNPNRDIREIALDQFLDNVAKYNSQDKIRSIVSHGHREIENILRGEQK